MKKLLLALLALSPSAGLAQGGQDLFVVQTTADVNTLDPAQAYDIASGRIIENVYETLYGYQGESVTEYEPRLATAFEVSSSLRGQKIETIIEADTSRSITSEDS